MNEREEAECIAAIIAAEISRRYARELRRAGVPGDTAELALLAGAVAIPDLTTILTEPDPLGALDEMEALERALDA